MWFVVFSLFVWIIKIIISIADVCGHLHPQKVNYTHDGSTEAVIAVLCGGISLMSNCISCHVIKLDA